MINRHCKNCHKLMIFKTKRYIRKTCSHKCLILFLQKSRTGKNNANYKDGRASKIYKCKKCKKRIQISTVYYGTGLCRSCACKLSWQKGRLQRDMHGKNNPYYKDGRTNKIYYCVDCCKEVSEYGVKRCLDCWYKFNSGKNHHLYIHGQGYAPYSLKFNERLRKQIRERDNYTCQFCNTTEKKHIKKYSRVLEVHHIDYNKKNCKHANLITVCKKCNTKANFNRDYYFAYFTYIIEQMREHNDR